MPNDGKLRISIKYDDVDMTVKISKEKSPGVYKSVMSDIKAATADVDEPEQNETMFDN